MTIGPVTRSSIATTLGVEGPQGPPGAGAFSSQALTPQSPLTGDPVTIASMTVQLPPGYSLLLLLSSSISILNVATIYDVGFTLVVDGNTVETRHHSLVGTTGGGLTQMPGWHWNLDVGPGSHTVELQAAGAGVYITDGQLIAAPVLTP